MDGDEVGILQLFEKAYRHYGGYTLKTPESWRWCCLQRPDVEKEGVLLVFDESSQETVGYAVAGKSGNLWELSYDPDGDGEEIVSLLLGYATAYLKGKGVSSVSFAVPQKDLTVKRVCKEHGFVSSTPPRMFLSILNINRLVSLIAENKASELKAKFDEAVLIKIKDAPFWVDGTVFIRVNPKEVVVEDKPQASTMQVETDYVTFSSLLFGDISPFGAFTRKKLTVKPLSKISKTLKLLSYLQIGAEWSFQLSDFG
jgi:putative sterol carrier protein